MNIAIELPDDVVRSLEEKRGSFSRRALETIAINGYRAGALSRAQIKRMLGFQTRLNVEAFLKQAGVFLDYTKEDFAHDLETLRQLRAK
jgi:predicted HTH domain antitoxin